MTAAQQFSHKAPLVGIIDQPFLFNFHSLMSAAARPGSEIRKLIDEAILAEVGVRVLWWHALGNNVIFSKGPGRCRPRAYKRPEGGVARNAPGGVRRGCGGRAAAMTIEKFHDAYKDGALDMSVAGFDAVAAYSLERFVDTVTFTHHAPIPFFLAINEKTWQALSPAHRAVIAQAATKVEIEISDFQAASEGRSPLSKSTT